MVITVGPFEAAAALQGVGPADQPSHLRTRLRSAIQSGGLVLPGATDTLGLRLIQRAGFAAAYLTGAGLANALYGLPDIGLLSSGEVLDHVTRLANSTALPLIVDADTGFGGPLAAMRTARLLERAGAAAIQIEDQEMPKRCGHFDEHTLIPAEHMVAKIEAVRQGLQDPATVLIARTDARGVYGIDEALRRATLYRAAGADILFVEAPRSTEELARIGAEMRGTPLLVNVVEGGKTPELPVAMYRQLGFEIVLYANYLMRSVMHAAASALTHLAEQGETMSRAPHMATWQQRQDLFNLRQFTAAEAHFDAAIPELKEPGS
jgi:2-methylisocitrate lyase-like PEP mutase family enzyme